MQPMLVMLFRVIFVPGMGECLSTMIIGNRVTIGMFLVRKVGALSHCEQCRVMEHQHQKSKYLKDFRGHRGHHRARATPRLYPLSPRSVKCRSATHRL